MTVPTARAARALAVALAAALPGCVTTPPGRPVGWCVEVEHAGLQTGGAPEPRLLASGGVAWGAGFGLASDHAARVPVAAWDEARARLWVRAAVPGASGHLEVTWAGVPQGRMHLSPTDQRDLFEWFSLDLGGPFPAGTLTLSCGGTGEMLLDQVGLAAPGDGPPAGSAPAVHRREGQEIRCSSSAEVFDPAWVFQLLRRQQRFVETCLGYAPLRRPVLAAVAPAEWPDPGAEAFQVGRVVFLRSDRLHLPWRGYTHELVHVFQEEAAPTPRFFLEGVAHVVALWAERDLDGRQEEMVARLGAQEALLRRGDPARQGGVSDLFRWGTEDFEPAQIAAAYDWSKALLWALAERHGRAWLAEVYRLLRDAEDPDTQALVDAAGTVAAALPLLRILSRAAGEDLGPWLEQRGLALPSADVPSRIPQWESPLPTR